MPKLLMYRMANSIIIKNCLFCKKEFKAPLAEHKRGKGNYCNIECFRFSINKINIKKNCPICNVEFKITHISRINAKFCSRPCYYISIAQKTEKKCLYCFKMIAYTKGYGKRLFCCISCSVRYRNDRKIK